CVGQGDGRGRDEDCSIVLKYGMKRDFNRWLQSLGDRAPVRTLTELRAWNRANAARGAIDFGQAQLDISDEVDLEADRARYESDRRKDVRLAGAEGIDAALREHRLDALLFPSYLGSFVAARAGYPSITVPFGLIPDATPPPLARGPDARPSPFG